MRLLLRYPDIARSWAVLLAVALFILQTPPARAQAPPAELRITIIDGDEAINNIRQRTAREPIVQVEDENHRPIAGAAVIFTLPNDGPGGVFLNGSRTLLTTTDAKGQAIARGLKPNNIQGQFDVRVNANYRGTTGQATIHQTNALVGIGAVAAGGISLKLLTFVLIGAAGAVGSSVYFGTRGPGPGAAAPAVTITPGSGTVGAPR